MNAVEYIKSNITTEHMIRLLDFYGANRIHSFHDTVRCCCPIHGGDNPTGFIFKHGLFYCHTSDCGGGDVFDFVAKMNSLDIDKNFRDVINLTASILGFNITNMELGQRASNYMKEYRQWKELTIRKKNAIEINEFNLNTLGKLFPVTKYRGFTKEIIDLYELKFCKDLNRIVLPIREIGGTVIGATMRRVDESEEIKWLHKPTGIKTGDTLFGIHLIQSACPIIVEGAFDVMKLRQLGLESVATFGAKLTDEQAKILMKHYFKIAIMYDGDKAGNIATTNAIEKLRYKMDMDIYNLPYGKDPGDLTLEERANLEVYKPHVWLEKFKGLYD